VCVCVRVCDEIGFSAKCQR